GGIVAIGGPRVAHMFALVAAPPVREDGLVDIAASFNTLEADERRESELVGFLSYLAPDAEADDWRTWRCVGADGNERLWRTRPLLVADGQLTDFLKET
ncbi:MAG: DUF3375 domain-containing protein, partial [Bifidobacterium sp.]|nr:DUF3375 domain-containing protein [Bifidobacterium sp.]